MNYNHINKVYDCWSEDILPYLDHNFTVNSFEDYLKRFSFLPSGKWLREMEKVKLNRTGFVVDPKKFVKKYKSFCITFNTPVKVEDGFQRIIYQISPTLHVEAALWIWVEHETTQSYISTFVCYHDDEEYSEFINDIYKVHLTGNTEDKPTKTGFADFMMHPREEA